MSTVLVTGASGGLGRHVVRHLVAAGHTARAFVHRAHPPEPNHARQTWEEFLAQRRSPVTAATG